MPNIMETTLHSLTTGCAVFQLDEKLETNAESGEVCIIKREDPISPCQPSPCQQLSFEMLDIRGDRRDGQFAKASQTATPNNTPLGNDSVLIDGQKYRVANSYIDWLLP